MRLFALLLFPLTLLAQSQPDDPAQHYCELLVRARLASLGGAVFEEVARQPTEDGSLAYSGQVVPLNQGDPIAFLCQLTPMEEGWHLKRLELFHLVEEAPSASPAGPSPGSPG